MEQKIKDMQQHFGLQKPEIFKGQESVKASHLSSSPKNTTHVGKAHFEAEVEKAFFKIFFGC